MKVTVTVETENTIELQDVVNKLTGISAKSNKSVSTPKTDEKPEKSVESESTETKISTSETSTTSTDETPALADVQAALKACKDEYGKDFAKSVLKPYGESASAVPETKRAELIEALKTSKPNSDSEGANESTPESESSATETTSYTKEEIINALTVFRDKNSEEEAKEILTKHNAKKVSDLKPEQYPSVMEMINGEG